jgi:hypothetical protein
MKTSIRKFVLTTVLALTAAIATVPAHATLSGSAPRPNLMSASFMFETLLSLFNY